MATRMGMLYDRFVVVLRALLFLKPKHRRDALRAISHRSSQLKSAIINNARCVTARVPRDKDRPVSMRPHSSRFLWLLIASILCFTCAPASADPETPKAEGFVVSPGEAVQIPIAISPIQGGPLGADIGKILNRDLEISGLFKILPPQTFTDLSAEGLASTAYDQWYTTGAEVLIKGRYTLNGDRLTIELEVHNVLKRGPITLRYQAPAATATNYRNTVHAFANAMIEYFGGGAIFGQTLLVVRRNRSKGESHVYRIGTDGEGLSRVSGGASINLSPGLGPGGAPLYISYRSNGPALVKGAGAKAQVLVGSDVLSRADYCPGNGRVVVSLAHDGNPELYTMDASGGGRKRLTSNGYIDTSPSWSPDCSKIAFVSNRGGSPQIYTMGAGGGGATLLTGRGLGSYNTSPAWSPAGDWIAFSGRDGGTFDIFAINVNSQEIMRVTQDQGRNEDPTWSADGKYLAFVSKRSSGSGIYITSMRNGGDFQALIAPGSSFVMPVWGY